MVFHCCLTGNSWGIDAKSGMSGLGLGNQEQFYGCADVAVRPPSSTKPEGTLTESPATSTERSGTTAPITTSTDTTPTARTSAGIFPTSTPSTLPPHSTTDGSTRRCFATGRWRGSTFMDTWCERNCRLSNCPATHCLCKKGFEIPREKVHPETPYHDKVWSFRND